MEPWDGAESYADIGSSPPLVAGPTKVHLRVNMQSEEPVVKNAHHTIRRETARKANRHL